MRHDLAERREREEGCKLLELIWIRQEPVSHCIQESLEALLPLNEVGGAEEAALGWEGRNPIPVALGELFAKAMRKILEISEKKRVSEAASSDDDGLVYMRQIGLGL